MTPEYLPLIASHDYEAFRRILDTDLPNTYNEWLQVHTDHRSDLERKGVIVGEIEVYPDEFARFVRDHGNVANITVLRNFVIEKVGRDPYR
jgi:hypothetical protein